MHIEIEKKNHIRKGISTFISFLVTLAMYAGAKFYLIVIMCLALLYGKGDSKYEVFSKLSRIIILLIPFIIILLVLVFFSIATGNQVSFVLFETRDVFITIFLLVVFTVATSDCNNTKRMINGIERAMAFVGLIKVCMVLYCLVTGFSLFVMVKDLSLLMGWRLQTYSTSLNFIARVQFSFDCVVPFILFFSTTKLINKENNRFVTITVFCLLLISVLLSMSRAFWAMSILFIMLAILINSSFKKTLLIIVSLTIFSSFALTSTYVNEILDSRMDANVNYSSDLERTIQNDHLYAKFNESPLLGKGIGYFIPDYTRAEGDARYTYESQVLSMFVKLGVVGFILLNGSLIFFCFKYDSSYKNKKLRKIFIKTVMIFSWLAMGAVNPLLYMTSGAMMLYLSSKVNCFIK